MIDDSFTHMIHTIRSCNIALLLHTSIFFFHPSSLFDALLKTFFALVSKTTRVFARHIKSKYTPGRQTTRNVMCVCEKKNFFRSYNVRAEQIVIFEEECASNETNYFLLGKTLETLKSCDVKVLFRTFHDFFYMEIYFRFERNLSIIILKVHL